jgi:hypothetical protein
MGLSLEDVRRYSRHIALPIIGVAGQERLSAARVALVGGGLASETAARYLSAAGVGRIDRVGDLERLQSDDTYNAVLWCGDDAIKIVPALQVPVVVLGIAEDAIDLISYGAGAGVTPARTLGHDHGHDHGHDPAATVLGGTLAAAEVLWSLLRSEETPLIRHLHFPFTGGEPVTPPLTVVT